MLGIVSKFLFLGLSLSFFLNRGVWTCEEQKRKYDLAIKPLAGRFEHSEGPHWDHLAQKLYFVDIEAQRIYKFDPKTNELHYIYIANGPVGVAVPVRGKPSEMVAGVGQAFTLIHWNGNQNVTKANTQVLATVDQDRNGTRWNDGKVDSSGRFWGGTIGPEVNDVVVPDQATFYCIESNLKPQKKLSPVTNSNGLAWNSANNKLYYIDTPTRTVAAFDYDATSATISNKRIAFDLQKYNLSGLPDGMTIDSNGNLWVALYGGSSVINVNPHTGELIRSVKLPVKKVTSVTFGGTNLDTLIVTTSSRDLTKEELEQQPYAGYVFAVHGLGVHGLPANAFKY